MNPNVYLMERLREFRELSQKLEKMVANGQVPESKSPTSGLGLSNIELRTNQIGATYQIDTQNGFCVTIRLPNY